MQVDPTILTVKAIACVFIAAQVFSHIYVWPRLPSGMRCDGIADRIGLSIITFVTTIFALFALWGAYAMVFVW